jgi:hypothetical protein
MMERRQIKRTRSCCGPRSAPWRTGEPATSRESRRRIPRGSPEGQGGRDSKALELRRFRCVSTAFGSRLRGVCPGRLRAVRASITVDTAGGRQGSKGAVRCRAATPGRRVGSRGPRGGTAARSLDHLTQSPLTPRARAQAGMGRLTPVAVPPDAGFTLVRLRAAG